MFAKTIIDSDAFLDMPLSTQSLYFHLSMRADDEGFINNPKKIQRMIGASDDDLKLLIAKKFIITFNSGVVVIKHWYIHNIIRMDRFKPTVYQEEKNELTKKSNKSYTLCQPNDNQVTYQVETEVKLSEVNLIEDKNTSKTKRFTKPTIEDIKSYCQERNNSVDAQRFYDYYQSNGWKVGKNSMKDWKAAIRTWERSNNDSTKKKGINITQFDV